MSTCSEMTVHAKTKSADLFMASIKKLVNDVAMMIREKKTADCQVSDERHERQT